MIVNNFQFQISSRPSDLDAFKDYRIPTVTEFIDVYLELKRLSREEKVLKRKLDFTKVCFPKSKSKT